MCKKFYKYKSFTDENGNDVSMWTLDSLANKYFYFSRPEQLNDPIDCRIFNEYEAEDKDIQNWIDRKPPDSRKKFTLKSIRNQLNTGDLVFFATSGNRKRINHVGIYLKDNKFIHASSSRGVIVSDLGESYYQRTYVCSGQVNRR